MKTITIPEIELFDEETETFFYMKETTLVIEHSLVSISKWESKYLKPFLSQTPKTREETLDYIRIMTITKNIDPEIYKYIPDNILAEVDEYINAPMTATTFTDNKKQHVNKREIITSEIIYYWMIQSNIPIEVCQKWHLNRLLALIKVCSIKNGPQKKMSNREILRNNSSLNAARKAKMHTKG